MSAEGAAARPPATSGLASPEAARRVIDLFEDVQRHTLVVGNGPPVEFTTDLTRLQRRILRLLGMSDAFQRRADGRWIFGEIADENVRKVGEMCGKGGVKQPRRRIVPTIPRISGRARSPVA
jgi:hypothetical protein